MASLYYLTAIIFHLCCLTTTFARENSTSHERKKESILMGCSTKPTNETTNSTTCKLLINRSEIKAVLSKHDNVAGANVVKLRISVLPGNKTRFCQKMELAWASEVGRTILTLVRRAKDTIFTSPLFTTTLEVGTEEVNIQVKEKIDGCLPPGERGSELIFDSLLRRLSQNDDTNLFKLCKAHKVNTTHYSTYNCCRIVGDRNLTICADYSSTVVEFAFPVVVVIFCISALMIVPFMLEYEMNCPKNEFFKTSDSPMSLLSIASMILFEGRGPKKSVFRRFVFVVLSYLVAFFPDFFGFKSAQWAFIGWSVAFLLFYNIQLTDNKVSQESSADKCCIRPKWDEQLISCFTLPALCLYEMINPIPNSNPPSPNSDPNPVRNTNCCSSCSFLYSLYSLLVCFIMIAFFCLFYFVILLICLIKFVLIDLLVCYSWPRENFGEAKWWEKPLFFCMFGLRLTTLVIFIFFSAFIFISILTLVASLTLNATFFNPFVAPILTLIVYFWKDWMSSVEAKCLKLKTLIIEISKEKANYKDDQNANTTHKSGSSSATDNSTNSNHRNKSTYKDRLLQLLCSCLGDQSTAGPTDTAKNGSLHDGVRNEQIDRGHSSTGNGSGTDGTPCITGSTDTLVRVDDEETYEPTIIARLCRRLCSCLGDQSAENPCLCCTNRQSDSGSSSTSTGNSNRVKNIVKFDKHGEAMISKELYEAISQELFPLDRLLFYFFRRVFFVGLYAFSMFMVMILARDSGASGIAQIISSILGVLIPFTFNTIFADFHSAKKECENTAIKHKLGHILRAKIHKRNTILVELVRDKMTND